MLGQRVASIGGQGSSTHGIYRRFRAEEEHLPSFRYHVHGRVQGVGYRYYAMREAERLGIAGYARNLGDGRVEVVAEGPDGALSEFEEALRRGPSFAAVESVEREPISSRGDQGFHVR
jgi:acylphosphatase